MPSEYDRRTAIAIPSERPRAANPQLVVISGSQLGQQFELGDQHFVIGRGEDATFRVDSDQISRRHACIERQGSRYLLRDLGSTNGTYVNDKRVGEAHLLAEGDLIRVGKLVLRYSESFVEAEYHRQVFTMASLDPLTGVYNKRYFDDVLYREVVQSLSAKRPLSLVLFDVDFFKKVNDTYGHPGGDAVLKKIGEVVRGLLSGMQIFCRTGGEEFAILMPDTTLDFARRFAEHLRAAVEATVFSFGDWQIPVTISIGVAEVFGEEMPEDLYKRADARLYQAKRSGRNRVC